MASSRTGTARYLRNAAKVKRDAQASGLTHCPGYERRDGTYRECGRELDYLMPQTDASAEADHVIEHSRGGTDDVTNLRVLCRACNRERNSERVPRTVAPIEDFPLSQTW